MVKGASLSSLLLLAEVLGVRRTVVGSGGGRMSRPETSRPEMSRLKESSPTLVRLQTY